MPQSSSHTALVPSLWPASASRTVQDVVLVLAGAALLAISAKIKVPFFPVPMTLQTFALMLIAATYGKRLGVATVVAYLAEGALGLPVFTNTPPLPASLAYFLGPTGGFLLGYIPAAYIVGAAADRGYDRSIPKLFGAMLLADVVVFALGFVWLAWIAQMASGGMGIGAAKAFAGGVAPFILADLTKILLAALLVPACWSLVKRKD